MKIPHIAAPIIGRPKPLHISIGGVEMDVSPTPQRDASPTDNLLAALVREIHSLQQRIVKLEILERDSAERIDKLEH